ncbi:MAG: SDR family NAD(P)-dependent oxidoreductase [Betaproteobacteria bacterium]|jgi:NAD(P)-dependent dehydrogenase (short-subunit alcohol dehydrogenase family)
MNKLDFTNRVAVITGGSSGIGEATAKRMSQSGAKVAIVDRSSPKEICTSEIQFFQCDVSDVDNVKSVLQKISNAFGRIDILVNSAGIAGINQTVESYPLDEWRRVLDVNLTGTFIMCRETVPYMKKNKYGRIVNISSVAGKEGNPTASAYSAAKAGVIALTRSLGKELALDGVLVNAVTPTTVETPILDQVAEAHIEYMRSKIPMGRFGKAEELAALISWLCTEECSFSTAAVFDASGGRTTY